MRTEKCKTCNNYKEQPESLRSGREWMNTTGFCNLPTLSPRLRRIHEDNWCDMYSEKFAPESMTDLMVSPEAIEGLDAPTPPYAALYDAIATVRAALDELQLALDGVNDQK